MTADYWPGDANVTVELLDQHKNTEITAHVPAPDNYPFGVGRQGQGGGDPHIGTLVWLQYDFNEDEYWMVHGHFKLVATGIADQNIAHGAAGTVSVHWKSMATDLIVDSTTNVEAMNDSGAQVNNGDRVTISDGTTAITFEASFQEDNASDSSYVAWEANPSNAPLTMARFAQKINEQSFSIGAAVDSTNTSKVLLQNTDAGSGTAGNVAIVVNEDLTTTDWAATGMSGGTGGAC